MIFADSWLDLVLQEGILGLVRIIAAPILFSMFAAFGFDILRRDFVPASQPPLNLLLDGKPRVLAGKFQDVVNRAK